MIIMTSESSGHMTVKFVCFFFFHLSFFLRLRIMDAFGVSALLWKARQVKMGSEQFGNTRKANNVSRDSFLCSVCCEVGNQFMDSNYWRQHCTQNVSIFRVVVWRNANKIRVTFCSVMFLFTMLNRGTHPKKGFGIRPLGTYAST